MQRNASVAKPPGPSNDSGYIMVVLLVGMAVAAIWMSALLPAWRQQAQRQKEEDLIFIGEQYARAIVLYQRKNRDAFPPNIEALVSGNYLRKAWKDPITGEDFLVVGPAMPGSASTPGPGRPTGPGIPSQPGRSNAPATQVVQPTMAGISGVRSKSRATSIKIYRNLQEHSLWPFDAQQMYAVMGYGPGRQGQPGAGGPGRGVDGRGGDGRGGPIGPGRGGDRRGGPVGPGRGGDVQLPPGGRGRGGT